MNRTPRTCALRRAFPAALLTVLLLSGCGSPGDEAGAGAAPSTDPSAGEALPAAAQPMTAEVQSLVDRGNTAQRERRYADALSLYREAMDLQPSHPIPEFGALMAALALGEQALADSLRSRLEQTAPELVSMLNPDGSMGRPVDPHAAPTTPQAGEAAGSAGDTVGGGSGGLPPGHPVLLEMRPDTTSSGR